MSDQSPANAPGSDPTPGYLPPPEAFAQPYPQQPAGGYDPLVAAGGEGIGGWTSRISQMFSRSWRSLFAIFALTHTLPSLLVGVVTLAGVGIAINFNDLAADMSKTGELNLSTAVIGVAVAAFVVAVVAMAIQTIGYGAGTYAASREALGLRVSLGEALSYGARRCLGLIGWLLVIGLFGVLLVGGLVAILFVAISGGASPGLVLLALLVCLPIACYLSMLTAMIGPAYLFERGNALGRAFRLVHSGFGALLGRLLLLALVAMVGSCLTGMINSLQRGPAAVELGTGALIVAAVSMVIVALVELPITVVQFSGVLLAYAEQRSNDQPITTSVLVAELDGLPGAPASGAFVG